MDCVIVAFAHWLPGATRNALVTLEGDCMHHWVEVKNGIVEIGLQPQPPRHIALLVVSVLRVRFRFIDADESIRAAFLTHFDHYNQCGSG